MQNRNFTLVYFKYIHECEFPLRDLNPDRYLPPHKNFVLVDVE